MQCIGSSIGLAWVNRPRLGCLRFHLKAYQDFGFDLHRSTARTVGPLYFRAVPTRYQLRSFQCRGHILPSCWPGRVSPASIFCRNWQSHDSWRPVHSVCVNLRPVDLEEKASAEIRFVTEWTGVYCLLEQFSLARSRSFCSTLYAVYLYPLYFATELVSITYMALNWIIESGWMATLYEDGQGGGFPVLYRAQPEDYWIIDQSWLEIDVIHVPHPLRYQ